MVNFIEITDRNHVELINLDKVVKIVPSDTGCVLFFNENKTMVCDNSYTEIKTKIAESKEDIQYPIISDQTKFFTTPEISIVSDKPVFSPTPEKILTTELEIKNAIKDVLSTTGTKKSK